MNYEKIVEELVRGTVESGFDEWIIVDWGEGQVQDMIFCSLRDMGYEDVDDETIIEIAKKYESEIVSYAEEHKLKINYNVPIAIKLG